MTVTTCFEKFEIGWILIEATDDAITKIDHCEVPRESDEHTPVIDQCILELGEYFNGMRKNFDVKINPNVHGTPFQQSVWHQLRQIPYGETISYKMLAERISGSNYSRAVANANGKNPISIIIPCHRVIASDMTLGGYTGGIDRKEKLLSIEQR